MYLHSVLKGVALSNLRPLMVALLTAGAAGFSACAAADAFSGGDRASSRALDIRMQQLEKKLGDLSGVVNEARKLPGDRSGGVEGEGSTGELVFLSPEDEFAIDQAMASHHAFLGTVNDKLMIRQGEDVLLMTDVEYARYRADVYELALRQVQIQNQIAAATAPAPVAAPGASGPVRGASARAASAAAPEDAAVARASTTQFKTLNLPAVPATRLAPAPVPPEVLKAVRQGLPLDATAASSGASPAAGAQVDSLTGDTSAATSGAGEPSPGTQATTNGPVSARELIEQRRLGQSGAGRSLGDQKKAGSPRDTGYREAGGYRNASPQYRAAGSD